MPSVIEQLNEWSQRGIEILPPVLWQSTLIAMGAWLMTKLLCQSAPRLRYWLWQLVAVKLLLMPFWTAGVPLPAWISPPLASSADHSTPLPHDNAAFSGTSLPPDAAPSRTDPQIGPVKSSAAAPGEAPVLRTLSWHSWLLLIWLAVVAAQMLRLIRQRRRLRDLIRSAGPARGPLVTSVREAAGMLQLARVPQVVLTDVACSPFVCGIRRPKLVLPRELLASLAPARLRHVLLHELAHLKTRDLLWAWIPEITRILYFFHPVAHWARYHIRLEQELACDQRALLAGGVQPAEYVDTLVQVVSRAAEPAVLKAGTATSGLVDDALSLKTKP